MVEKDLVRVFSEPEPGDTVELGGSALSPLLARSPRPGAAYTLVAESGRFFRARLVRLDDDRAEFFVFERMGVSVESRLELVLIQALPDKERMELVIEKSVELGVDLILPFRAARSADHAERLQPKDHRWQKRALKAMQQCRRAHLPLVAAATGLAEALAHEAVAAAELKIMLWEQAETPLRELLAPAGVVKSAALLVGPEGGLAEEEAALARSAGFMTASLGARVLRSETAAIAGAAILQYLYGGLGGGPLSGTGGH